MFPRNLRLRRKRDIAFVLRRGRIIRTPYFILRVFATTMAHPRVTVVVSTAVAKKATVRNRVKRQIRHILMAENYLIKCGVDLMLSVKPPILTASRDERRVAIHEALRRVRLV